MRGVSLLVAVVGLGIAGYLTAVHYAGGEPVCATASSTSLQRITVQYEQAVARAAQQAKAGAGGFSQFGSQVQNASFQLADFAVQVGGGTSPMRAMAQQLPQLLGGFGVMGDYQGQRGAMGRVDLFTRLDVAVIPPPAHDGPIAGISVGQKFLGWVLFVDQLRVGANEAVQDLKDLGTSLVSAVYISH